jgi:hypothetical protein
MAILEREFYRSARGPAPADEDTWQLVFDRNEKRLFVRHEWHATRHVGMDEFTLGEFLSQRGAAPEALLALLFDRVTAEASVAGHSLCHCSSWYRCFDHGKGDSFPRPNCARHPAWSLRRYP